MKHAPDLLVPLNHASTNPVSALIGRRLHHRQKLSTLAYVNLDQSNGGIVRDLSEAGIAIQTVMPLRLNQGVELRFDLLRPRLHVEALGRVAWADPRGQAGVQFLNLNERLRRPLKQWIFTQLLARAQQVADSGFVFDPGSEVDATTQLQFSASVRPAIRLEPEPKRELPGLPSQSFADQPTRERRTYREEGSAPIRLHWLPFPIRRRAFANLVDGLVLISAFLLFSVLAMGIVQIIPAWPAAVGLMVIVTAVFARLYRFLFIRWTGTTPGAQLAELAARDSRDHEEKEERPRFR